MTLRYRILLFLLVGIIYITSTLGGQDKLKSTANCVCAEKISTYECSVTGGTYTVWRGSILQSNCEITLVHDEYMLPGRAREECNNGDVVGIGIKAEDNCYISRLNVSVTESLEGLSIECYFDDGTSRLIGTIAINITTEPFPSPINITLSNVVVGEVTFSWNTSLETCPSLKFYVFADNCGTCQNNTDKTSTTCTNFDLPSQCSLGVQSVICESLASSITTILTKLKVPEAPLIEKSIPWYDKSRDERLSRIDTIFTTEELHNNVTSNVTSVSGDNLTITYMNTFGNTCGSFTFPVSSCISQRCSHSFNTLDDSSCPSSSSVIVTVYATNGLGRSLDSNKMYIDGRNNFVNVTFDREETKLVCSFKNQQPEIMKQCSANVTYGENCDMQLNIYTGNSTEDMVSTKKVVTIPGVTEYCFLVTANISNVSVVVQGNLVTLGSTSDNTVTVAIIVPLVFISLLDVVI